MGYYFDINDQSQIFLTHGPLVGNYTFQEDDLHEILNILSSTGCSSNLSRLVPENLVYEMATKACRKSIMIGTPLEKATMKVVLKNLAQVEYPW
ncbi:MAG: ATP-binding mismatch repair protein, partial [Paramarteilia canceri]